MLLCESEGREANSQPFEHLAHFIEILNLFGREQAHEVASIGTAFHEPFLNQSSNSFTQGGSTDGQILSERTFVELRPRKNGTRLDQFTHFVIDTPIQRIMLSFVYQIIHLHLDTHERRLLSWTFSVPSLLTWYIVYCIL